MIHITAKLIHEIEKLVEAAYPEEGAGLLLGHISVEDSWIEAILPLGNAREPGARHNRYALTPQDWLLGEQIALQRGLDVIGVYHSHPDHPNQPSEFDREWALPNYIYMITGVQARKASGSRAWKLNHDHAQFYEEEIYLNPEEE